MVLAVNEVASITVAYGRMALAPDPNKAGAVPNVTLSTAAPVNAVGWANVWAGLPPTSGLTVWKVMRLAAARVRAPVKARAAVPLVPAVTLTTGLPPAALFVVRLARSTRCAAGGAEVDEIAAGQGQRGGVDDAVDIVRGRVIELQGGTGVHRHRRRRGGDRLERPAAVEHQDALGDRGVPGVGLRVLEDQRAGAVAGHGPGQAGEALLQRAGAADGAGQREVAAAGVDHVQIR